MTAKENNFRSLDRYTRLEGLSPSIIVLQKYIREFITKSTPEVSQEYRFGKTLSKAIGCFALNESSIIGQVVLDQSLSTWESLDHSLPIDSSSILLMRMPSHASQKSKLLSGLHNRIRKHNLSELEKTTIVTVGIENDIGLLDEIGKNHPEALDQIGHWAYSKLKTREERVKIALLVKNVASVQGTIRTRTLFDAEIILEDFEHARAHFKDMLDDNIYDSELPEKAIQLEELDVALALLLSVHRNDLIDFSRDWILLGESYEKKEKDRIRTSPQITRLLPAGATQINFASHTESLPALLPSTKSTSEQGRALSKATGFDEDLASILFFTGIARVNREKGIGLLKGMAEKIVSTGRFDLLDNLARSYAQLSEINGLLNLIPSVVSIKGDHSGLYHIVLQLIGENGNVEMMLKAFEAISKAEKQMPNIMVLLYKLVEEERYQEATNFIIESDQIARRLIKDKQIEQIDEFGLPDRYILEFINMLEQQSQGNLIEIIAGYFLDRKDTGPFIRQKVLTLLRRDEELMDDIVQEYERTLGEEHLIDLRDIKRLNVMLSEPQYADRIAKFLNKILEVINTQEVTLRGEPLPFFDFLSNVIRNGIHIESNEWFKVFSHIYRSEYRGDHEFYCRLGAFTDEVEFKKKAREDVYENGDLKTRSMFAISQGDESELQGIIEEALSEPEVEAILDMIIGAFSWVENMIQ
ncbi:hypothetical protein HY041_01290 [Candidatus Roizmanbacteria bacterium]|nr:hypothetical protein [Candidatus Roizmanbacteria bacterium]